ncbi:MAG: Ig-like domain-containing protein [Pseudomonadota bacterium]
MSAIDFVVRDGAGNLQRGSLGGADGSVVSVSAGQDVSLNLMRGNILSYTRQGSALQITLVDGTVLTLEGFFGADGGPVADLYLSANGALAKADLTAGTGDALVVSYADADSFGKWSPDDDLYFVRGSDVAVPGVVPVAAPSGFDIGGALPLIGGAAALAGLALLGGGDDDDTTSGGVAGVSGEADDEVEGGADGDGLTSSDSGDAADNPDAPNVEFTVGTQSVDHTVNADDHSDGVDIGGTGTPGATGTLTVGDVAKDFTIGEDGTWTVNLTTDEVPGGDYEQNISVTVTDEGGTATANDVLVVDTVVTVTIDTANVETDGVINFTEEADGFTLTGTVDADAAVTVTIDGNTYDAVVTGTTWSLDVAQDVIAQGEYDLEVTVNAVDAFGNTSSTSGIIVVDTVTSLTLDDSAGGADGVVNAAEHPMGVEMKGLTEGGATVAVTLGDVTKTVTAEADGTWSAVFTSAEVPTGEQTVPVTATATDAAGNTATASGSVTVDTEISITIDETSGGADGVINFVEREDGVTLTGETEAGATVDVTFDGQSQTVTATADGTWSADYDGATLPEAGEGAVDVAATATDAAGNTASTSTTVDYDTYVNRLAFGEGHVEGDNVVNRAEASDGVTLNGVVEVGSSVLVTFGGVAKSASVTETGAWSVTYTAAEMEQIGGGQADGVSAEVLVEATDAAGNTATISDVVEVDMVAPDMPNVEGVFRVDDGVSEVRVDVPLADGADFHQFVDGADAAEAVSIIDSFSRGNGDSQYEFAAAEVVPDGSHLIVNTGDAAGNSNATLLALEETANNSLDLTSGALDGFNIGAIDLDYTNGTALTITTEQLQALSDNDNDLVIHGGSDDVVRMDDLAGVAATEQRTIEGETYDVYSLGDDTNLIIDSTIQLNPVV